MGKLDGLLEWPRWATEAQHGRTLPGTARSRLSVHWDDVAVEQ